MGQTLYHNGTILTMEDGKPYVEAVLTEEGRIVGTGSCRELKEQAGPGTYMADLEGNVMLPGFIDPHSHFTACASRTMEADLENAGSFDDIMRIIREYMVSRKVSAGQWVQAANYDHNNLKEGAHPRREMLDVAFPHNPVVLKHQSGHMGVFNTMAMDLMGITDQTEAPQGGVMEKEEGRLTGYMEENAFLSYQGRIPMPSAEDFLEAYGRAQELYASCGITTVQEGLMNIQLLPLYKMLLGSGLLMLDLVAYMDIKDSNAIRQELSAHEGRYKDHMKLGGCKIFLDGSPQGRTAWMRSPYVPVPGGGQAEGYRGYGTLSDEEVLADILKAEAEGMQLLAHCNGDRACQQYLEGLQAAYARLEKGGKQESRRGDIRPVMIHAQLLGRDQLRQVKELGIIPSFFLAHIYHWGDVHIRNFGMERAAHISPAGSALKEHITFTLHQDSPVIRPDMLETLWCAITRRSKSGVVLGADERIPMWEALKAVTINGAYQYFEEHEKGSIAGGNKADVAILDRNPMETEPEEIRKIRILAAIKEGQVLWKG